MAYSFYPETTGMYVSELEHVIEDGEPLLFEAETEAGPVRFKYSVREYGEDEIAVKQPAGEPGTFKEVTVYRDTRPHLEHPVPKHAKIVESRHSTDDGRFLGSTERFATLNEIATALTTARDLFKRGAFRPLAVGSGQR